MYAHSQKIGKTNNLQVLENKKPKGLSRIAKIGSGHPCLREIDHSFINNNII